MVRMELKCLQQVAYPIAGDIDRQARRKTEGRRPWSFLAAASWTRNLLIYQRNKIILRNIKYADKIKITARITCLMTRPRYEYHAKNPSRHHAPAPYPRRHGNQTQAQLMRAMSRDKEREPLGAHLPWQRPGYRSPRLPAAWWWSFTTRRGHRRQLLLLDP